MRLPEGGRRFLFYDLNNQEAWEASLSEDRSPFLLKAKKEGQELEED